MGAEGSRGWPDAHGVRDRAAGSASRANLEQNGVIAIGFSPPTIARALQVKGSVVEQHADFFAGPDNSRGEVIVRKNNVVWVLTVENCGPSAPLPAGAPRILQR
jgi:hypothetical protein